MSCKLPHIRYLTALQRITDAASLENDPLQAAPRTIKVCHIVDASPAVRCPHLGADGSRKWTPHASSFVARLRSSKTAHDANAQARTTSIELPAFVG